MLSFVDRQVFDFETYTNVCQDCGVNWQTDDSRAVRYVNNISAEQIATLRSLYAWADRTDPDHSLRNAGMRRRAPAASVATQKRARWGYAAALCLGIAIPSSVFESFAAPMPPVEYKDWHMAKPVFAVGEPIHFTLSYRRDRLCSTIIDRRIMRTDGTTAHSMRTFGSISKINSKFEILNISLDNTGLPTGEYVYSGLTHSECGRDGYDAPHPELAFTVR